MLRALLKSKWIRFVTSFLIVALGQPALVDGLGPVSAAVGFALFFSLGRCSLIGTTLWFAAVQLVQLSWMSTLIFQGPYILAVYLLLSLALGLQFALFARFVFSSPLSWGRLVSLAALWALFEWSRLFVLCGFSWNPVGLALSCSLLSLQWASVLGVLGLSFWVMLTNLSFLKHRGWGVSLAIFPYLFGALHLAYHDSARGLAEERGVALLQTARLPSEKILWQGQEERFIPPFEQWRQIARTLASLEGEALDLLILPEAAVSRVADSYIYPRDGVEAFLVTLYGPKIAASFPPRIDPYGQGEKVSNLFWCQTLCNALGAEMVVGLDYTDPTLGKNFNSAFYLHPQGRSVGRYDKQILLPLGEYLPFSWLKAWTRSHGIAEFFSAGSSPSLWGTATLMSPSICYEETFSALMRSARRTGAELLVNLTNDNYYPHSMLHRQHLFHARLRSVENGVPLLRACNGGISAVIDSMGRVVAQMEEGDVQGALVERLNIYIYRPLYFYYGETGVIALFLLICACYWGRKSLELKGAPQLPSL